MRISRYLSTGKGIMASMLPAIFLDRDGVIIENHPNYVRSWDEVVIYPQALDALVKLNSSPYKIIIVTNQSAVGRGIIPLETAWDINRRLVEVIQKAGGRVDGVFMCPHAPDEGCDCRKPKPGLFFQAARDLSIDLQRSVMIGDALSDLLAGQAAGIPRTALVLTGRGTEQTEFPLPPGLEPYQVFENLAEALEDLAAGG
jgi:D-glycero-D-manno-heptose 1,7-bisphosphate phosphatase